MTTEKKGFRIYGSADFLQKRFVCFEKDFYLCSPLRGAGLPVGKSSFIAEHEDRESDTARVSGRLKRERKKPENIFTNILEF
ncbi:hypothetical protein [Sphingobacterium spiritivorum]|uniref:hypothetical protein n=1 Tax=Sphingobacterium spiritivorum TaxID=258 RepID=UPI003DA6380B